MKNKTLQANVLYNFIQYAEVASEIARVQNAINTDTAYLGKSIYSSISKLSKLRTPATYLAGVSRLIKDTTQGGAIGFGLEASVELFSSNNLFPIQSEVVTEVFEQLETELDRELPEDLAFSVMTDIRSSLFVNALTEIIHKDIDIEATREELLYGRENVLSLAKQVHAFQQETTNPFIKALSVNLAYDETQPDVI